MSKFLHLALALAVSVSALSGSAIAADKPDNSTCAKADALKIASGPADKGYDKLVGNISVMCGDVVPICNVKTDGALDNLNRLASNQVDLGISTVDTLRTMQEGNRNISALKALFPLNFNYLHLVVGQKGVLVEDGVNWMRQKKFTTIVPASYDQLKGQTVGAVGSAQLWARKLNEESGLGLNIIDIDDIGGKKADVIALDQVKSGAIAGYFTAAGWSATGTLGKLKSGEGVKILPFNLAVKAPYQIVKVNYSGLGQYNLPLLGAPNLLLSRPFQSPAKIAQVTALQRCLKSKLADLQDGSFEPGWSEIQDPNATFGVAPFVSASVVGKK